MSGKRYYKRRDKEFGPVSFFELKQLVARGTLDENAHVRKGPEGCWVYASGVAGLFAVASNESPGGDGEATPVMLPRLLQHWNDWRIVVPVAAVLLLMVIYRLAFRSGSPSSRAATSRTLARAPERIQRPPAQAVPLRRTAEAPRPTLDPAFKLRAERIARTLEAEGLLALSADDLQFAYYGAGREALLDRLRAAATNPPRSETPKCRWLNETAKLLELTGDLKIELALEVQRLDAQAFKQLQRWLLQVGTKLKDPSQSLKAHEIDYARRSPFLRRKFGEYQKARRRSRIGSSDSSRDP